MDARWYKGVGRTSGGFAEGFRWSLAILWALFAAAPLILLWRRLSGELQTPLAATPLVLCTWTLAVIAWGLRRLTQLALAPGEDERLRRMMRWLPSVGLVTLWAALCVTGTSPWGAAIAFLAIVVEAGFSWRTTTAPVARRSLQIPFLTPLRTLSAHEKSQTQAVAETVADHQILQRLTHGRSESGQEYWHGVVRVEVLAQQRVASAHVAFCPPFSAIPQVSAEHVDGSPAEVTLAQTLAHGARFDIKLQKMAECPGEVVIEFTACQSSAKPE